MMCSAGKGKPRSPRRCYGKRIYENYLGPTYYSFNYEHCHFIALDSIAYTENDGEPTYYGFVDNAQLEWLRQDLSVAGRSRPIILVTHIPTINALASYLGLRSEMVTTPDGKKVPKHQIANFRELLEILNGSNLRLALAGHYHTCEEVRWKDNQRDALFVLGGSVCGEWWKGDREVNGTSWPEGFTVVKVDGEEFELSYVSYGWRGTEEQR